MHLNVSVHSLLHSVNKSLAHSASTLGKLEKVTQVYSPYFFLLCSWLMIICSFSQDFSHQIRGFNDDLKTLNERLSKTMLITLPSLNFAA